MQLQPHFLFNTLHAISSLIHTNPDAADEMMAQLGEFLRYTLEKDSAQEVPLAEELEMLDHYLEIEKIRLAERLTIRQDVPDDLHSAMVPNLILQPLVENAIRHGIAPRQSGGCLEIAARKSGDRLSLSVCDDGPGLPERSKEGVGFSNTRSRLEQLYAANQSFECANKPEGGVCVTLEFPLRIERHEIARSTPQHERESSHAHR
jgi:LytS/YehU family sensor histidine kinase